MKTLEVPSRAAWRAWLASNHAAESEIWLVYYKKGSGVKSLDYGASVEEALCFGWIDSIIKRLDDERYVRKFTPRSENSNWSAPNIQRVEKMIRAGKMTPPGLRLVEAAKAAGKWDQPVQRPALTYQLHPEFEEALRHNQAAKETFENLAATYRKQYIAWIETARLDATRQKRIAESLRLLEEGKKLGLR